MIRGASSKKLLKMKKKGLFLAAFGLCMAVGVSAQRGSCGTGVSWTLENGTLTISGEGDMSVFSSPQYSSSNLPSWDIYKDNITRVVIEGGVKYVGDYAFYGYGNLKEVTFAEGLKAIGGGAFYGCTGLTSVEFPASLEILGGYYSTRDEVSQAQTRGMGSGWARTSSEAFAGCTGLTSVTIPATVWAVGSSTFRNCINLRSVYWGVADHHLQNFMSKTSVDYGETGSPFTGCAVQEVTFGSEVDSIPGRLFYGQSLLSGIRFSGKTEYVGKDAFYGTAWQISLPEGLTYIDKVAYLYKGVMTTPTAVSFAEGTKSVTEELLAGQTYLTKVTIPSTLTVLGEDAFVNCRSLGEVEWNAVDCDVSAPFSSTPLYSISFGSSVRKIPDGLCSGCDYLTGVSIPQNVKEIGRYAFSGCSALVDLDFSEELDSISPSAFADCSSLESVVLPEGLRSIPDYAFDGCTKLSSVDLPDSLRVIGADAFQDHALQTLVIPEKVEYIGERAFYQSNTQESTLLSLVFNAEDCEVDNGTYGTTFPASLRSMEIGDKVQSVPYNLTRGQSNLVSLKVGRGVQSMPSEAFASSRQLTDVEWNAVNLEYADTPFPETVVRITFGDEVERIPSRLCDGLVNLASVSLPASVKSIGFSAFAGSGLTSIVIPDNVTEMEDNVFENCASLVSVGLGRGLTSVPWYAFSGCVALTGIDIPENVTQIENGAFYGCTSLASVSIPNSVNSIGDRAFRECSRLSSIRIGEGLAELGDDVFEDCDYLTSVQWDAVDCQEQHPLPATLTHVTFGPKVERIPSSLCASCSLLTRIELPASVKAIGSHAFSGCSGLQSIQLPEGLQTVENFAFQNCSGITSVDFPSTLSALGIGAFYGCGLTSLFIPATLASFGNRVFEANGKLVQVIVARSPFEISSDLFAYCDALSAIYVPDVHGFSMTNGWMNYASQMKPMASFDTVEYVYSGKEIGLTHVVNLPGYTVVDVEGDTPLPVNAGEYNIPVRFSFSGANAFAVSIPYRFHIAPKELSVSVKEAARPYGEENPEFELTFDGFVEGEDASALNELPVAQCDAGLWSEVGDYPVWLYGGAAMNYAFSYQDGTLHVTQADQEITWSQDVENLKVGDKLYLEAVSSSGYPVEFILDETAAASLVWDEYAYAYVLTCRAEGEITLTAVQHGDRNYAPAEPVVKNIVISSKGTGVQGVEYGGAEGKAYVRDGHIIVEGLPAGMHLRVYASDGMLLHEMQADGNRVSVPVGRSGLYIVKWSGHAMKLMVDVMN